MVEVRTGMRRGRIMPRVSGSVQGDLANFFRGGEPSAFDSRLLFSLLCGKRLSALEFCPIFQGRASRRTWPSTASHAPVSRFAATESQLKCGIDRCIDAMLPENEHAPTPSPGNLARPGKFGALMLERNTRCR